MSGGTQIVVRNRQRIETFGRAVRVVLDKHFNFLREKGLAESK